MRKFKLNKWVAAGLMVTMPYAGVADAAGLGGLRVLSQLGQPFAAEIDLVNVSREELASLKASLASPSAYQAANLSFNPSLNALRLSVERRPNGTPYIRATSFRPVAEPYLDLLIELSWAGGKIVREYSALLDPPGMEPPAAAMTTPPVAAAAAAPAATQAPAVVPAAPAPKPAAAAARPAPAAPRAAASQYAVKHGDTLSGIARQVGPEGVSLEQTLIGLFQANPDAFSGGNINQLRAGRILNVPEREQLAAIGQGDAAQQVRVHAANWNAYRRKVADTAPTVADAGPAAKGRITTRVEDPVASAGPKDVVVLSKGDSGSGAAAKGAKGADRVRVLEEDLAARDKALAEANSRVAQLEKTLKEMQKLAEIKSQTVPGTPAKGAEVKPEAQPAAKPEAKAEPPKAEGPKPEAPKVEPKPADTAPPAPPKPVAAAPKKPIAPPPPPPEPSMMDTVMENIVPIGGGAAALLAGIGGIWALRRRKKAAEDDQEPVAPTFKTDSFRGNADTTLPLGTAAGATAAAAATADMASPQPPTVANVTDVVDPIDEAQVYIDHGRDTQAEEILKEAMGKQPEREDVPLKLLEVYAARGDKVAFNALAGDFHKQTGGVGENWKRAAALGYAVDPTNPLYPSTGESVDLATTRDAAAGVDLDLGTAPQNDMGATMNILLDQGHGSTDMEKTMVLTRDDMTPATPEVTPGAMPDFNIELPAASEPSKTAETPTPALADGNNMLEFNIELPAASAPAAPASTSAPDASAKVEDAGLDFKVDFSNINLNLDDAPATATPAEGAKDPHWEDVQQKFDLARAYQEMGDKEGALEILHEVEREGDAQQKAEAQKLIQSLK